VPVRDRLRPAFLSSAVLQQLLDKLLTAGYRCLGPVAVDGAIQFCPVTSLEQFPRGIGNLQEPGKYQFKTNGDERFFAWNHGPQGLKPLCFASEEMLWSESRTDDGGLQMIQTLPDTTPMAVFGLRACDLAALELQDRHFLGGDYPDPHYQARRERLLLIGVDCAESAATCFCASSGDGPALDGGMDIGLAEVGGGFLAWAGSEKGAPWLERLETQPATDAQLAEMVENSSRAGNAQTRHLPEESDLSRLYERLDHSNWQDLGERCLSCGNCTAVCPTCFCHTNSHEMALDGLSAQRVRRWDSCFSPTHSEMGRFQVRSGIDQRYRQWLTHKLAGWQAQYGRSGCVGCGRCITWCPVGIDLTREVAMILYEGSQDV
jgi:ferredoxin